MGACKEFWYLVQVAPSMCEPGARNIAGRQQARRLVLLDQFETSRHVFQRGIDVVPFVQELAVFHVQQPGDERRRTSCLGYYLNRLTVACPAISEVTAI